MCGAYAYGGSCGSGSERRWMRRGGRRWSAFAGAEDPWSWGLERARRFWGGRFFQTGELHLALLSLLSEGPRHGYQLMKDLEERSGGMYRASAGAIYPTLQQLEDEDLAKVSEQEGKRVYRITEAGKKEVEANKEAIARIWERAKNLRAMAGPEHLNVFKPAMHVAMAAISAATRGGGEPDKIKKIREILEKAQQELDKLEK